ncbi:hypothetical protein Q5P01_022797 [Channa striata]|uniref:Telomerase protein component 1 n=1 Tax=Channa striata TaxID=64152 RepID=A0AA88LRQ5_CHASR|nr:hypothetical protein Q5P01_022797 [Channa striata]
MRINSSAAAVLTTFCETTSRFTVVIDGIVPAHPQSLSRTQLGGAGSEVVFRVQVVLGGGPDGWSTGKQQTSSGRRWGAGKAQEGDVLTEEEKEVGDAGLTMALPVLEPVLANQELEQTMVIRQEEFAEFVRGKEGIEELKDKKYLLLNAVCCSLVNKNAAPGQEDWESENSVWTRITNLAKDISVSDPEFLLKVAVYTRQELNVCITANFLVALAASQPSTKPHVRRYFCAAVQLPSDWLEVARIYSTCFSRSLPMCLKKAMTDKFKQFSEYQLAKYSTHKHCCKHRRNRPKSKKPDVQQLKKWSNLVRANVSFLKKFVEGRKVVVDKKQSDFSMKKMIRRLHIKEPAEHVMAILGQKYPSDLEAFTHSGLKGVWDRERAGQRMKLKEPETWDQILSLKGNKAATWEKLIDNDSLPFMDMLRNLRNMITKGISETHHKKVLSRLTNKKEIIHSREFPFRFLAAYKVIMELQTSASTPQALPPVKEILKDILKRIPKSTRFNHLDWDTTKRTRMRTSLGVPFISRMYRKKKAQLLKANQRLYTVDLLDRYREALEAAVQVSCQYNVPPLPGRTVILLYSEMETFKKNPDFCLPPDPEQTDEVEEKQPNRRCSRKTEEDDDKLAPSMIEVAVLLSLLIASSAEDCQIYLNTWKHVEEVKLRSETLLENVRRLMKQIKAFLQKSDEDKGSNCIFDILTRKNKVDNIVVMSDYNIGSDVEFALSTYMKDINSRALLMQLYLSDIRMAEYTADRNNVVLTPFSEEMLRFVAERGSSRLLDHVESLYKIYNISLPEGAKVPQMTTNVVPIPDSPKSSTLVSTFSSKPTCLVVSADGELTVVGTVQGTLHFISTQTGQEVKSLVSSCDGISSCVYLNNGRLATTSFDGRIEIWDTENGCRTALIDGHTNVITSSDVTADQKHFATVSLDFMLKVWSTINFQQVAALPSSSPLNCVTFDPEGHLLAAGCWNGNVIVWNWLQNKTLTSLRGHQRSVRSLCFSSSSSTLCSGSVSGEVRVWSVPTSTCVGCFQAHCGATEALTFLDEGAMLLSAGADHTLQLWSGGFQQSITALTCDEGEQESLQKNANSGPAALCVAVNGDYAAVGYHGRGIKLFSLNAGEKIWSSSDLDVSVLCLLWVVLDAEQTEPDLLVSGGSDKKLRVWKRKEEEGKLGHLEMLKIFGVQLGTILALAQNSTYLATASDDFTIALWLLSELTLSTSVEPHVLLSGHSGGVTCLAFSADGGQLLSGGKDQALMLWDVSSSPAVLSKSLPHSHRDWLTGCVWTPHCVISASNDGSLCFWDLQSGHRLREISWSSPLTSVCCLGQYVMAGCAEGGLHVWNWETSVEICHIAAHKQRIHHCCLLPNTESSKPEEMSVFTASDDGTVQLWKPLQVGPLNTFQGHSGAINKVVCKEGVPEFLTVSDDCSLRCWTRTTESHPSPDRVTVLCFSQNDDLLLAGYESGLLEMWHNNRVVGHKQAFGGTITAICTMPDGQFAVSYMKCRVDVWKLMWNPQHCDASLLKITTYKVMKQVVYLAYYSILVGISEDGTIFDVTKKDNNDSGFTDSSWTNWVRILGWVRNDENSIWLVGERSREVTIGFSFAMGPKIGLNTFLSSIDLHSDDVENKKSLVTAVTVDQELVVCGDIRGNMWFNQPPDLSSWSSRKPAHGDRISALKVTDSTIISASFDMTVKLWDRNTMKQLPVQPSSSFSSSFLQPSSLSSTSSSLLSTTLSPSFTSPLLSTQNKLLTSDSPHARFSLTSSIPKDTLLSTSLPSGALHSRHALPPSFHYHRLSEEQKRDDGGDRDTEEMSEVMQSCSEDLSVHSGEEEVLTKEGRKVEDAGSPTEVPVLETAFADQDLHPTMIFRQEEFAEVDTVKEKIEEQLKEKKYLLLNAVCCTLVNKTTAPGRQDWDSENSLWTRIINLAKDISVSDPEFLLKVAIYARLDLDASITANFLVALAANQPSAKPHVRRYFCAAVQLPSDWLEVARIYSTCFSRSLPTCLKKAMADKFTQFSECQLAKCNTRKQQGKNRSKMQIKQSNVVVDRNSDFSMKKMIKRLHIKEPAEHVMAILGQKYPADPTAFAHSGLKGAWDKDRAGQRMKLKEPETWEHLLSRKGNTAATWEKIIDDDCLSFMDMLRNLRNIITLGISEAHHKKEEVIGSQQLPFRFLLAYKVIMELQTLTSTSRQALPTVKEILKGILKTIPKSRRFSRVFWEKTKRRRIRATMGVPFIYRLYRMKKAQMLKAKDNFPDANPPDRNCVKLTQFSEQMLRVVAAWGSPRLLDHVEHLDKVHNIPPAVPAKAPPPINYTVPIPDSPKLRWRCVRVFVSSTFRDMHAERDVLVRSVFPELRRRAAPHCLYLQEVELRWGVTEEELGRATELCLSEVCSSQMMVGILGERYGLVPSRPVLPELPQYSWLASAPASLSITEMEIRQFEALYPDTANQRMFCYFRDPNITKSVPVAWKSDFVPESQDAASKMASLKSRIQGGDVKVTENYPCEWGGVVDGKPYLKNLEDFGKAVLEDLWTAVVKLFVEEDDKVEAVADVTEQEVHQEALQQRFLGRAKLLSGAVEMVEQVQTKGGMMVVEGGPGQGKTVFMAALADALRTGVKSKKNLVCDVLSYSTAASQSARSVENLLRCFTQWFRKMNDTEKESPLPHSYKDLLSEFHSTLSDTKKNKPLMLLVDGVDLVRDGRGQLISDWIPQQLPQGVCLVVSIPSKAALLQTLARRRGAVLFTLGQLTVSDRKEIVQRGLDTFGKKLSDSAFNNQLQTLIMKNGAASPLYLHLACEDLRNFASFDKLKDSLQGLPQSLSQLVQYSLDRLCSQYRDMPGLRWALAVLTVSTTGLRKTDWYSVLNTCNDMSSRDGQITWKEVLHLSRKPEGRVPMATFVRIMQSLQSLVGSTHCHNIDEPVAVTNPEVKQAFEEFLLPAESDRTRAHLILAAHLWVLADPQGKDAFFHGEANSVLHLPYSLILSGQLEALQSLLSNYYFLYANVRHGLLHHLLETYSLCDDFQDSLMDCHSFLQRHAPLLSSWPDLFIQQALNELPETSAHKWAQGLVGNEGVRVVEWLNRESQTVQDPSKLVSTFSSEPTCLVLNSDGELMVVGTMQGMLHFIQTQTGQEVTSLVSSCDGISSCVFLNGGRLATTSFDGQIEIWDLENGCRTALIDGHTNAITASDVTADQKHFATVSLDLMIKVWSSSRGREVAALASSSPLNCVTFDPEGHLLASGTWDGNVIVWNWLQNKTLTSLRGHQRSVRSLCFSSSSSSTLCSGSVSGEVRVWSVPTSTCVGCFQAHCGATEALTFLDEGAMLLSAGADHTVERLNTFRGHSGAIRGVVRKAGVPEFLTVSEDCSLRCWTWTTKSPFSLRGPVTALCFSQKDGLLLAGYESGLLELWQNNRVVGHEQASDNPIVAICSIPDGQFAVSYVQWGVDVWKLVWNHQHCNASWNHRVRVLDVIHNDAKSLWLLGIRKDHHETEELQIGFLFAMGLENDWMSAFSQTTLYIDKMKNSVKTAATMEKEFVVCGDVNGNIWFNCPPEVSLWRKIKMAHSDRISVLKVTDSTIISASYDRTVKLWDRNTKKQVGMFVCAGPVLVLDVNPEKPTELVCEVRAHASHQANMDQGEQQQQTTSGRSLCSSYTPLNLENNLTQTSMLMTQPCSPLIQPSSSSYSSSSLQPTSLSSTFSSLLPTTSLPSLTSTILSTHNKLLMSNSPNLSSSLTSPLLKQAPSLLSTFPPSSALQKHLAHPPLFSHHGLGGEVKKDDEDKCIEEMSEVMQSSLEETCVHAEEENFLTEEEKEVDNAGSTIALPVLETLFTNQELEQTMVARQEEFDEFVKAKEKIEGELKDKKYLLLNDVCCSLIHKSTAPGQKDWDSRKSVWTRIIKLAHEISVGDPEFLLKVAVYTRQELSVRITANFLVALAANQPATKPHVRRYFCAAVQLPSDWLEVARIYSTCFSSSLPMCLKKAMADKFKQFSEYQLAKYNTRKHRCKCRRKSKKPTDQQLKKWADLVRADVSVLKSFMEGSKVMADKKQSVFSMKKMIKRLHIKDPAEHVMAILGKKYPADLKTFTHSGMKGAWDRERAGQRMKLKEPETWDRLLSLEGNKAATWEKLIDNKSLPFMAMLRNLRNMITKGISEAHHKKILSRLTNEKAVIQSRQFPFRFLAAYKVIMELHNLASTTQQALPTGKEILKGILKRIPKSRRFIHLAWEKTHKKRIGVTLRVPFVCQLYRRKKDQLLKSKQRPYTVELLERYRKALETAVQISFRNNVPLLPGRTVIILDSDMKTLNKKLDFCFPPDEENNKEDEQEKYQKRRRRTTRKQKEEDDDKLGPSMTEVAVFLSLMIASNAEDCQIYLNVWNHFEEVKLKSDVLLANFRSVMKRVKSGEVDESNCFYGITSVLTKKNKVDNIILLDDNWTAYNIKWAIKSIVKEINNRALVVQLLFSDGDPEYSAAMNCVTLRGFSEQMLRFVAERGSSRLLDHVEHLDKVYNIPPPEEVKSPQGINSAVPIPAIPKLRWRSVRVFVSSTFRDMHAERDVLVRSVFPELRRRAAPHCLYLQEVELRWGVTEEESGRATELCLSEVCRSQMMVGILGERYGLVPSRPVLPDLPQYSWLASAPPSLSITEMEIRQFQALFPDTANQRMFCYFRDPNITKSVPVAWKSDFIPESQEAESKMAYLKSRIQASDVKVTQNYPCEWGGVVDGKPYLKNLEDFGKTVLEDLWTAVVKLFVEEDDEAEAAADLTEQEVHQGALQRQFFGRGKLLSGAVEIVEQIQAKGGMMVVEGGPGEGKTVFMAALADIFKSGAMSKRNLVGDVISYSTAASESARSVENLLRCFVQWFRKMKETEKESPLPHSYKDLLSEFHSMLSDVKHCRPLVLFVDGVDLLRDHQGQLSSDWIPQQLPRGVCLVVSITSKSALLQTLAKKRGTVLFTLGKLTVVDRKEIVKKGLDVFGKKLSDSAFNNQLQTLIMKNGAASPLYLHLACEDLRNFASFDKLNESLQNLPQSLSQLVQYSLDRLCSQYRDMPGLHWALAVLTVSTTGLMERDLYSVLNTCNVLTSRDGQISWQEVLRLSRKPEERVPMATFTHVVQSLQSLVGSSHCCNPDDLLALTNPEVKRAFEDFLLPAVSDRSRAHLILAAHLWVLADPQGTDTFLNCEANSVMQLPSGLIQSGQLEALHALLSSYYFLYANVRHGLLHHLLETYSLYSKKQKFVPSIDFQDRLKDCHSFLQRHAPLLSSCPALFIQQALNELPETSAHKWARGLVGTGGIRVVEWLNSNNNPIVQETSKLVSTFSSEPNCLVLSSDGELMVVGTRQGTLHFIHTQTGQEVKSMRSSCDGISSCVFLKDGHLATTSFDGQIEIWDVKNGCRTALIDGHTNVITASDVTADQKHFATVSLDLTLKVWSSNKGHEVAALPSSSPLNCVTFDPEGHLLAAGCWNGNVIMWNWLQNKTLTSLRGHQRSVRSLCFSSSSTLCSGSVSGEVRVWSVPTSTCVGCFQAHCGATEALTFLDEGAMLLSAGSDHTLHLWSAGLGRSVTALKSGESEQNPPQKKWQSVFSEPAALCVAVNRDNAAVGYHAKGVKLFSLDTGEKIWSSGDLDVSVLCLLWVVLDAERTEPDLLVSGGSDKKLRVWKRKEEEGKLGHLEMLKMFGVQLGTILALAQNSTYLATASDDCTVALWLLSDLALDTSVEPHALLRGHSRGVTCLAFSPDGGQLLSGGKDQALLLWDVSSSPAVLSKSLPHSHRDWITGCVWTPDCVISSSNDGRLCLWDLQTGQRLREISWSSPLTSVCCLGQYVMAGCAEGRLHVWNWETSVEICHIAAHKQRIHHCSLLPNTEKKKDPEEMSVFTASDDGTVQLWKPLQVEHFNTFQGHCGAVLGVVHKEGVPEFLTVSEDCSLRCWTWTTESPVKDPVTALCFSQKNGLLLAGYGSGLLELWRNSTVVDHKQALGSTITAICSMPDSQFAVSHMKCVDVWKLVWNQQHTKASLVKVTTYSVEKQVVRLIYNSVLIGVSETGTIMDIANEEDDADWDHQTRILGLIPNDERSMWLLGEEEEEVVIGFIFALGTQNGLNSDFGTVHLKNDDKEGSLITALTLDKEFVVCGDLKGNMWFNHLSSWSIRKPVHNDRISVLKVTDSTIISASYDRTVKLWDRHTKKQVGLFVCAGPVLVLEVNPEKPNELVCGDGLGKLYFLTWKE